MPITIRQNLAGTLGRLAVMAGEARGQQLRMTRGVQLAGMAMAAQDRAASIGMAARDRAAGMAVAAQGRARQVGVQDRAFAMQQAAAAQITKQRPAKPDARAQQQRLHGIVAEAEAAGIYAPARIKQMRIYAGMGDEPGVMRALGELPPPAEEMEPTARRRELGEQLEAITEFGRQNVAGVLRQLGEVNQQLGTRFTPEMQKLLRERPELMETVDPGIQSLLAQQQQLEEQGIATMERTEGTAQMIRLGISVPEQMAIEERNEAQLAKQEEAEQRRVVQRVKEAGTLSERDELSIDVMRDQEKSKRTTIGREIAHLSKDLAPFADEDDADYVKRTTPINTQIKELELTRTASYAKEKKQVAELLRVGKETVTPTVTDSTGQQWQFTGNYRDGKPLYEAID